MFSDFSQEDRQSCFFLKKMSNIDPLVRLNEFGLNQAIIVITIKIRRFYVHLHGSGCRHLFITLMWNIGHRVVYVQMKLSALIIMNHD